LAAVTAFKALPESHALAAANKRVGNLLKKNSASTVVVSAEWFEMDAEKALAVAIAAVQPKVAAQIEQGDYQGALSSLVVLKTPVDAFFDGVMVMADNVAVRNNRLALLGELSVLLNSVADISVLTA
jgi:glycyl-tRNA synthetase beta chain